MSNERLSARRRLLLGLGSSFLALTGWGCLERSKSGIVEKKSAADPFLGLVGESFSQRRKRNALNNCENPLGASPKAIEAMRLYCQYPESYQSGISVRSEMRTRLGKRHRLPTESIFMTPGSREALRTWVRYQSRKYKSLIVSRPEYQKPAEAAEECGLRVEFVQPRSDYKLDLNQMIKLAQKTSLIYLSNPHLPFGGFYRKEEIANFLRQLPKETMVLVDEAYIQFFGENYEEQSAANLITEFHNLVVSRTFSKIYGLASVRLGYLISHPETLTDIFPSYDDEAQKISILAAAAGIGALEDHEHVVATRKNNDRLKKEMQEFARSNGMQCVSEVGNFVCLVFPKEFEYSKYEGFFDPYMLSNNRFRGRSYVRVSLKLDEDLKNFKEFTLKALKAAGG